MTLFILHSPSHHERTKIPDSAKTAQCMFVLIVPWRLTQIESLLQFSSDEFFLYDSVAFRSNNLDVELEAIFITLQ